MNEPLLPHEILDAEPIDPPVYAMKLAPAVADSEWSAICSESCPHLRRTEDGDPRCVVWDDEPLTPSFEVEPITPTPRAERCVSCFVAEDIWGHRA